MQPLAERLRPRTLDEYIGQKHLVGPGAVLRKMIDAGRIFVYPMGSSGSGKDNLGADYRQQAGNSFLYAQCRDQRREGRARRDRARQEQPFLLASQSHPLH